MILKVIPVDKLNLHLVLFCLLHRKITVLKRIFKYFEPAWTGNDNKVSLRAVLAIAFSIDFIRNINYAIFKWDAGRSLEGLSLTLGIEA